MATATATARVVVGGTFACDEALARPLHTLLDAVRLRQSRAVPLPSTVAATDVANAMTKVIGQGAVRVDWLSYGSVSELSQWVDTVAPEPASRPDTTGGDRHVHLAVLLVRVSDLEAAHPELQASANVLIHGNCSLGHSSNERRADTAPLSALLAFARDLEAYAALPRDRPPVVVLFCPPPPLLAERHAHLELLVAQRLGKLAGAVVEVIPSSHLVDLYAWHYTDPGALEPAGLYYDPVSDHREHAPFTWRMQRVLALAICRHVRRCFISQANAKKCVVLDCDNTLWGGAVAEVGALELELSPRFLALQRFAIEQQRARGLALCLCSKNIPADVDAAFQDRKEDMPLRLDEHIAISKINWAPKSRNIRAIADELSLGLDSFVFIDDNPVECSEVVSELPMVAVIHLPADFTAWSLHHEWVFDKPIQRIHAPRGASLPPVASTTVEDRERTRFYQQNRERERLRHEAATHTAFLSSLGVRIEFDELALSVDSSTSNENVRGQTMARVLQLHHRTNQFSTSTTFAKRLDVKQLEAYATRDGRLVLCARVTDRFGHYGLVSVVLCRKVDDDNEAPKLQVDSFLLSCRALNRGVEHAMVRRLATIARRNNAAQIVFDWEPTERNQPAQLFFESVSDAAFTTKDAGSSSTAEARLASATSLGQWILSVEDASRITFLKAATPASPGDRAPKPTDRRASSPLTAATTLISSSWGLMRGITRTLLAWIVRALVLTLLSRWLSARFKLTLRNEPLPDTPSQRFMETPFRTRGSLERFLSSKLAAQDDPRSVDGSRPEPPSSIDHNEISKFRRKARHRTKLALADHLHEESTAVVRVWSANRRVESDAEKTVATVDTTCKSPSCSTRVTRESTCAFQRCRNCCYRIQRLLHRASSPEAHATARSTAQRALDEDFDLLNDDVDRLITAKQRNLELEDGSWCPAHRNKRRIR